MAQVFKFILGFGCGSALGIIGAFVHANRIIIGNQQVAYGFILMLTLIVASQLWLGRSLQSRLAPIGLAVGWAVVTLFLGGLVGSQPAIITDAWYAKVYVFGGAIICGMVSAFPVLRPVAPSNSLEEPFTNVMEQQPPL